jgi:hypothetical protein
VLFGFSFVFFSFSSFTPNRAVLQHVGLVSFEQQQLDHHCQRAPTSSSNVGAELVVPLSPWSLLRLGRTCACTPLP